MSMLSGDIERGCVYKHVLIGGCSYDCAYCSFPSRKQKVHNPERTALRILETARKYGFRGIFLTSTMGDDPEKAMDLIIDTAECIRNFYRGYLHLKILPGASRSQIKTAVTYGDRVSINLEAPNGGRLSELSSMKDFRTDIIKRQRWIREEIERCGGKVTQTTQMVVGAGDETDLEIIESAYRAYRDMKMARVYYSRFIPLKNSRLENRNAESRERIRMLYRLDALIRLYGYSWREIQRVFDEKGNLLRDDPKFILARRIDIKTAGFRDLLRVPGIGIRHAEKIMKERGKRSLGLKDLKNMGVNIKKARAFISGFQRTLDEFC